MSETTQTQTDVTTTDVKVDETAKNEEKQVEKTLNQDEVNRIISERLDKVQAKHQKELTEAVEKAKQETEKLAKMSQEEREKELTAKQAEAIRSKEKELTLRENRLKAGEMLTEKGISLKVVDFLVSENAEEMSERIETFKTVYDEAVQEGIKKALAGNVQKDVNTNAEIQDDGQIGKRHF